MNKTSEFAERIHGAKAFLFDLDGTIVDSNDLHSAAYLEVLKKIAPEKIKTYSYAPLAGKSSKDSMIVLGFNGAKADKLAEEKQSIYREYLDNGKLHCIPFMKEIIILIAKHKKKIFVVTGSSKETVKRVLKSTSLEPYITGTVCAEDVSESKPLPAPFLKALEHAKSSPDEAIAVEDSVNGIISAIAAGVYTLSVDKEYSHKMCMKITPEKMLELLKKSL